MGTQKKIKIKPSPTADTRYCDFKLVTKKLLIKSSKQHIGDVRKGMEWFSSKLKDVGKKHDYTKLSLIDEFHRDFVGGFESQLWYKKHRQILRHHISMEDGVKPDVNVIDLILYIVDTVSAGISRGGQYRFQELDNELLQDIYFNSVKMFLDAIEYLLD